MMLHARRYGEPSIVTLNHCLELSPEKPYLVILAVLPTDLKTSMTASYDDGLTKTGSDTVMWTASL